MIERPDDDGDVRLVRVNAAHDCGYVEARNALIDRAAVAADRKAGATRGTLPGPEWRGKWDRAYHAEMARLWGGG